MLRLNLLDVCKAIGGNVLLNKGGVDIDFISLSSKDIKDKSLFIPIIGENLDGHNYMDDAYNNGCRMFLIDKNHSFKKDDITLVEVDDTTKAFGYIAKYYRNLFDIFYIGITGSVGKTSTKDIIYSVLSTKYNTLKNEGNFNNEIGLPKTLLTLNDSYDLAVLEMGMSYKNEIRHLADIVRPKVAVISNIGLSHIEHFDNQDGIFDAKMEITSYFDKDNILVVNGDDKYLKTLKDKNYDYKIYSYGFDNNNDIICNDYSIVGDKIKFVATFLGDTYDVVIPSVAKHNIYNSMAAIVVGKIFNISKEDIIKGLSDFSITKGRLSVINKKDITIIDDSYNANSDSMISALNVLKLYNKRRVAILGDILEVGDYEEKIHREVGANIVGKADLLVTVGKASLYIKDEAIKKGFDKDKILSFDNCDHLLLKIDNIIKKDDVILVKSSHGIGLSKVVEYLDGKYKD